MRDALRYFAYLAFAGFAILFWGFWLLAFALGDRVCDQMPCLPPPLAVRIAEGLIVWGSMPITALTFIPYRRFIKRILADRDDAQ